MTSLADKLADLEPRDPRVLTWDIENSPNICYAWQLYDVKIAHTQIIEPSRVLCVAAKWLDSPEVIFYSEHTHTRTEMIQGIWSLLDQADILVGYNHVGFDLKHINREFLLAGMAPPSPSQNVDLYRVVRSTFKFPSNKLAYVVDTLSLDSKMETGGQALWNAVLQGDEAAWATFQAYNETDVRITEQLYRRLAPYIKGPHRGLWSGELSACPACDSFNLLPAGTHYTKVKAYPRLVCEDCGAHCRVLRNGETRGI